MLYESTASSCYCFFFLYILYLGRHDWQCFGVSCSMFIPGSSLGTVPGTEQGINQGQLYTWQNISPIYLQYIFKISMLSILS